MQRAKTQKKMVEMREAANLRLRKAGEPMMAHVNTVKVKYGIDRLDHHKIKEIQEKAKKEKEEKEKAEKKEEKEKKAKT